MVERLRYLGLASESTFNEPTPPAATIHVDIASASLDAPDGPDIVYEGGLTRTATTRRPGFYSPAGNLVYAFDIDSIGHLLKYALEGYVFTVDVPEVGLNTHEFYGTSESLLPSFVARLGKDKLTDNVNFEHVFSGCTIGQLAVATSDALAQVTADVVAATDSRDDILALTDLLLPSSFPLAFHELTASIKGTDRSTLIKSVEWTVANNLSAEDGRSIGARFVRRIPANERATTFAIDLFWDSIVQLQEFWGGTDGPASGGSVDFATILTYNAGDDGGAFGFDRTLIVEFPASWYSAVTQQASGRGELVQSLSGMTLAKDVTLIDTVTIVNTDVYVQLINDQPIIT